MANRPSRTAADVRVSRIAARNIHLLRDARGMTQQRLAEAATTAGHRMERATVANIERGVHTNQMSLRPITIDELCALADALGVPVDRLITAAPCDTCQGAPPRGFTCTECGNSTPKEPGA